MIRLLGPPIISGNGEVISKFRTSRIPALLGYLASSSGVVTRENAAEALWPGRTTESANHNLRQALFGLRAVLRKTGLDEYLSHWQSDYGRSQLKFDDENCANDLKDLAKFDQLLEDSPLRLEVACRIIENWRGPFLEGIEDDWVLHRRERLSAIYVRALLFTADSLVITDPNESLRLSEIAISIDPWLDGCRIRKISALKALGEEVAAFQEYESFATFLDYEIGMQPSKSVLAALEGTVPVQIQKTVQDRITDKVPTLEDTFEILEKRRNPADIVRFACSLVPFWISNQTPTKGIARLEPLLNDYSGKIPVNLRIHGFLCLAELNLVRGDLISAEEIISAIKELLSANIEPPLRLKILEARIYSRRLRPLEVIRVLSDFTIVENSNASITEQIDAYRLLALAYQSNDELLTAIEVSEKARDLAIEVQDHFALAELRLLHSQCLQRGRDYLKSKAELDLVLTSVEQLEGEYAIRIRLQLARYQEDLGDLENAEIGYRKVIAQNDKIGDEFIMLIAMTYLGDILCEKKSFQEALYWHGRTLTIRRNTKEKLGIATSLRGLGRALLGTGRFKEAQESFVESAQIYKDEEAVSGEASSLFGVAQALEKLNESKSALSIAQLALLMFRRMSDAERLEIGTHGATILQEAEDLVKRLE